MLWVLLLLLLVQSNARLPGQCEFTFWKHLSTSGDLRRFSIDNAIFFTGDCWDRLYGEYNASMEMEDNRTVVELYVVNSMVDCCSVFKVPVRGPLPLSICRHFPRLGKMYASHSFLIA